MQTEKVIDYIVNWLKDYATKGVKGFVIGVSGGVDSGVVSTLCAMTGLKVLALEMPIRQQKDQASRALEHIDF
jgi:NAD+ synthase